MLSINKYRKRTNHKNINTPQQEFLNQAIKNFNEYIDQAPNKLQFQLCTNIDRKDICTMIDVTPNNSQNGDEKYLLTYPNSFLKQGNLIQFINKKLTSDTWLIVDEENLIVESHKKFKIRPTNYLLKFVNKKTKQICECPAIVNNETKYTLGVHESNAGTTEGDSKFSIKLPLNNDTVTIDRDDRFIIGRVAWDAKQVDATTEKGIMQLLCGESTKDSSQDDLENGIADRWKYQQKHEYTFNYNKELTFFLNDKFKYNLVVKEDGKVIYPDITLKYSDNSFIQGDVLVKEGKFNVTIIVKTEQDNYELPMIINVIDKIASKDFEYEINSNMGFNIKRFNTNTFIVNKKLDGNVVMGNFDYRIDYYKVPEDYIKVIKIENGLVKIKNNKGIKGETITLVFIDKDSGKTISKDIKLINMG